MTWFILDEKDIDHAIIGRQILKLFRLDSCATLNSVYDKSSKLLYSSVEPYPNNDVSVPYAIGSLNRSSAYGYYNSLHGMEEKICHFEEDFTTDIVEDDGGITLDVFAERVSEAELQTISKTIIGKL